MAFPAFHGFMESPQREPGFIMIESQDRFKGVDAMTFLTIGIQLPAVIIFVTGGTVGRNGPV